MKTKDDNSSDLFSIKKSKVFAKWTEEEDSILIENIKNLKIRNKWKTISKILGKKVYDCKYRYRAINSSIKKGHWTEEEDQQVIKLINIHGKDWAKISSIISKRTGKQIRQRFLNFLDSTIKKEKFSIDEDLKIFKLFNVFKTNWRYYIKFIPGRTADMIKGRYYSSIRFKENFLKIVDGISDNNLCQRQENELASEFPPKKLIEKSSNINNFNKIDIKSSNQNIINIYKIDKDKNYNINDEKNKVLKASKKSSVESNIDLLNNLVSPKITYLETNLNSSSNSCINSNEQILLENMKE